MNTESCAARIDAVRCADAVEFEHASELEDLLSKGETDRPG